MSAEEGALILADVETNDVGQYSFSGRQFRSNTQIPFGAVIVMGMETGSTVQRLRETATCLELWTHPDDRPALRSALMRLADEGDVANAIADALNELSEAATGRPTSA
jgi:hypothetical protein